MVVHVNLRWSSVNTGEAQPNVSVNQESTIRDAPITKKLSHMEMVYNQLQNENNMKRQHTILSFTEQRVGVRAIVTNVAEARFVGDERFHTLQSLPKPILA